MMFTAADEARLRELEREVKRYPLPLEIVELRERRFRQWVRGTPPRETS